MNTSDSSPQDFLYPNYSHLWTAPIPGFSGHGDGRPPQPLGFVLRPLGPGGLRGGPGPRRLRSGRSLHHRAPVTARAVAGTMGLPDGAGRGGGDGCGGRRATGRTPGHGFLCVALVGQGPEPGDAEARPGGRPDGPGPDRQPDGAGAHWRLVPERPPAGNSLDRRQRDAPQQPDPSRPPPPPRTSRQRSRPGHRCGTHPAAGTRRSPAWVPALTRPPGHGSRGPPQGTARRPGQGTVGRRAPARSSRRPCGRRRTARNGPTARDARQGTDGPQGT